MANTGNDFADFLLGLPETSSISHGADGVLSDYFRSNLYNAFAMDDWRVASNFTLNLGVRYEYFTPWQEKYGHIANLDVAPGFAAVAPVIPGQTGPLSGAIYPATLIRPDRHDFGPRLGIAWKPSARSKIVVRAGYGIYYTPNQYNQFESNLAGTAAVRGHQLHHHQQRERVDAREWAVAVPAGKTITNTYGVALELQRHLHSIVEFFGATGSAGQTGGRGSLLRDEDHAIWTFRQAPNQAPLGSSLTAEQRLADRQRRKFHFRSSRSAMPPMKRCNSG